MAQSLDFSRAKVPLQGLACDCFGVPQRRRTSCCLELPESRLKRPDLAIYNQEEEIAAGREPTWDNPDIIATALPPVRLMDETLVSVRNLSSDTWAIGAQVHFSITPFGWSSRSSGRSRRVDRSIDCICRHDADHSGHGMGPLQVPARAHSVCCRGDLAYRGKRQTIVRRESVSIYDDA